MFINAITAILAITTIVVLWLLVQVAWRRVFPGTPADEDVLAGRLGCHGCKCKLPCAEKNCLRDHAPAPPTNQPEH